MKEKIIKIKEFLLRYEYKIVVVIGLVLVSAISYQFGVLQGQKWQQKPLIIEKPLETPQEGVAGKIEAPGTPDGKSVVNQVSQATTYNLAPNSSQCAYVGSKNSDKFYLPTCSYAKRVKPENLICFKSAQEAISQGRVESKCN
ncbi:MAG: hypothetical protein ACD_5C00244G0003 [uncultured bacterium]|nr:MAG: hypothetical protein ACD_5C00244G0003 [uncultured bacterium]